MKSSTRFLSGERQIEANVLDRLASAVSVVCVPPVMSIPLVLIAAQHVPLGTDLRPYVVTLLLAIGVLPAAFVAAAFRLGYVSNLSVSVRSERRAPALFTAASALAAFGVLAIQGAPPVMMSLAAALACQLATLAFVTNWWRVSYHTASVAGLAFAAQVLQGPGLAIPLLLLAGLVAWSRVRLGRHTPAETVAGMLSSLPVLWWPWSV